jgi:MFS transporter, NNP family, nitrate/nitrite transporter
MESGGRKILGSQRQVHCPANLIWSIVAEHIGFSVWLIWSIVATKLPQAGFHYTTDQLFQLVALPGFRDRRRAAGRHE